MLHEIFKGMDNAAEQINENFEELSKAERIDVSDTFSASGAEEIEAYLVGKTVYFNCIFTPSPTNRRETIAKTTLSPIMDYALICSLSGVNNLGKSISAEIRGEGEIIVISENNNNWSGVRISGEFLVE